MKRFARFKVKDREHYGIVEEKIYPLEGNIFCQYKVSSYGYNLDEVKLLPPCQPTKIILVGLNYHDHIKESSSASQAPEEPVIFMKPPSSLIATEEKIIYPAGVKKLDFEAELAVVMKERCKGISPEQAINHIFGYTCLNDITARDLQRKDVQWTRAKSFDTFCPLGPFISVGIDPSNLKIESYLNGKVQQSSNTNQMIFSVEEIISFVSKVMTLLPGDIISTGTPAGVNSLIPEDTIEIRIEHIGTLRNYIRPA
ncbi:MAG: fumarylacetoacetate hydrolase family protein [candidate division Zixibacteria bacterium]|nr:fumarylacetoacetate hydrolase family protein [candidate division Zixibacteria bacterium]